MLCPVRKQKNAERQLLLRTLPRSLASAAQREETTRSRAEVKIPTLATKISFGEALQEIFEGLVEFLWVVDELGVAVPVEAL
jgi:hypothetical protein